MNLDNINLVRAVKDALRRFQDRGIARFQTSEVVTEIVATGFWDAGNVRWAEVDRVIRLYYYGQGVYKGGGNQSCEKFTQAAGRRLKALNLLVAPQTSGYVTLVSAPAHGDLPSQNPCRKLRSTNAPWLVT